MEKNQINKDVKKAEYREKSAETTITEVGSSALHLECLLKFLLQLTFKATDLQRQLSASQTTIQNLTADLNKMTNECESLKIREQENARGEDNKLRVMLAKLKGLEDELVSLRYVMSDA